MRPLFLAVNAVNGAVSEQSIRPLATDAVNELLIDIATPRQVEVAIEVGVKVSDAVIGAIPVLED